MQFCSNTSLNTDLQQGKKLVLVVKIKMQDAVNMTYYLFTTI